jgi:hypothetical protein
MNHCMSAPSTRASSNRQTKSTNYSLKEWTLSVNQYENPSLMIVSITVEQSPNYWLDQIQQQNRYMNIFDSSNQSMMIFAVVNTI